MREAKVSGLEAERFLIESNKQREKTKIQRLREYKRLKEIETELAVERKKATLKKGTESPKKPDRTNLSARGNGRARSKAAATVGLSENTAEKGLAVLNKAESGDLTAAEALKSIDRNELSVDRAYREIVCKEAPDSKGIEDDREVIALAALDEADEFIGRAARAVARYNQNKDAITDKRDASDYVERIKGKLNSLLVGLIDERKGMYGKAN